VNGMNSPAARAPPVTRAALGPHVIPCGCGGASRDTVGLLVNIQPSQLTVVGYFVGLANRPDLQAKVEM
jgi:hypothetical protein